MKNKKQGADLFGKYTQEQAEALAVMIKSVASVTKVAVISILSDKKAHAHTDICAALNISKMQSAFTFIDLVNAGVVKKTKVAKVTYFTLAARHWPLLFDQLANVYSKNTNPFSDEGEA